MIKLIILKYMEEMSMYTEIGKENCQEVTGNYLRESNSSSEAVSSRLKSSNSELLFWALNLNK